MRRAKATVRNSLLPSIDILSGKDAGRVQLVSSIDHREGKPQVEPRFYHNIYIYTYDSHRFIVMLPIKRSLGIPTFLTNCMALAVSSHILRPWKRTDWLVDHYCSGKACSSSHSLAGKKKYPIDPKFNMSSYKQLYFWGAILTPHIIGLTLAQIAHQSKHSAKKTPLFGTSSDQQQKLWDLGANQSCHFRPHGLHQIIHVASAVSAVQVLRKPILPTLYIRHITYVMYT